MTGFLLIDKPADITSHDVVDQVRRVTGERTVGHAGTLDPFATGLLLVAVGRESTKQLSKFVGLDKEYIATLRLGASSTTGDLTGVITPSSTTAMHVILSGAKDLPSNAGDSSASPQNDIQKTLNSLLGPQLQTPPMHSAKKIGGKKLYELARKGETIERAAVPITIYELALMDSRLHETNTPEIDFRAGVSSGTYIRTLGEDIAKKLGTEGYLTALRRTKIGAFKIEDAIPLDKLTKDTIGQALRPSLQ